MAVIKAKGMDVSYAQGTINWQRVKASGQADFAMLRATASYPSGKASGIDKKWPENVRRASAADVPFGIYHYSYASCAAESKLEATHFLHTIHGYRSEYPVALDFEEPKQLALPLPRQTEIIETFLGAVEDAGYYTVLYMSAGAMKRLMNAFPDRMARYDRWVAHVGVATPMVQGGLWQYSWKGSIPGIRDDLPAGHPDKSVDLDYAYKDYPAIIKGAELNGF